MRVHRHATQARRRGSDEDPPAPGDDIGRRRGRAALKRGYEGGGPLAIYLAFGRLAERVRMDRPPDTAGLGGGRVRGASGGADQAFFAASETSEAASVTASDPSEAASSTVSETCDAASEIFVAEVEAREKVSSANESHSSTPDPERLLTTSAIRAMALPRINNPTMNRFIAIPPWIADHPA